MSDTPFERFEPIIGLEIHAQLNTRTKLFGAEPHRFGDEPNTNIGFTDTAQPGALPVINEEAVKKAVRFGLAIKAQVSKHSKFDRKSYFYPDAPKGFQITQFDEPIIIGGEVHADGKVFEIDRAHLEDDAGMLRHFSNFAGVDFNRCGAPLIEIVSTPCMRSPKEASAYAMAIRSILEYIDASDCNMEEGSLRMDVNVSVREKGETGFRNKVEIKNMNSFGNMEMAIESEIRRQIRLYLAHPGVDPAKVIAQSTCRFDLETKETVVMRSKEEAADYRYFPEPDLPPLVLTDEFIGKIAKAMPELPFERLTRYKEALGLSEYSSLLLVNDKKLSDYYEQALKSCDNAKALCNWVTVEFVGRFKDKGVALYESSIEPEAIAKLVNMIEAKTITGKIAKCVADDMVSSPEKSPEEIVEANPDYKPLSDVSAIEPLVDQVIAENPESVADYQAGITKAFNYLVGQIMKLCRGKASPQVVQELLKNKIK